MAAVREPSEPSMKPLRKPVWSMGSLRSWWARILMSSGSGVFEGQPFGDAELEVAFFFQFFVDEEILPVAEVLHAGDAVGERVGDGELVALAAFVGRGRRNDFVDEVLGGLAKNAGGLAVGVEVDGSALRRLGFAGDARSGEGGGVGDGDVAVDAVEKRGMAAR